MWESFTGLLYSFIEQASLLLGVNEAIAIIVVTLFLRLILLPMSVSALIRTTQNKAKIFALQSTTKKLAEQYKNDPAQLTKKTMTLYKNNNITFIDKISAANMFSQAVLGLGMFQAIKGMLLKSKFLWIETLGKPDIILALIVGVLTYTSMALMPGSADQVNHLILIIPAVISVIVLITFPSAIGLYMAASSIVNTLQSAGVLLYLQKKENQINV